MKTLLRALFGGGDAERRAALAARIAAADAQGDAAEAIAARRAWLALTPDDAPAWIALAEKLRREGLLAEAAAAYEQALANGTPAASALLQLGAIQTELDDFPAAQRSFEQLVAMEPQHADGWCMLGVAAKEQGRFDDASRAFGQALTLNPHLTEAHFNLGLAQFELGQLAQASSSFTRCVELRRGLPWSGDPAHLMASEPTLAFEPEDMGVNEVKLRHDCEQLEYLLGQGLLPEAFSAVLADYRSLLQELRGKVDEHSLVAFDAQRHPQVARTYKRPILIADVPAPASAIVNPALDFDEIQDRYLAADPNVLAVDNLLTPQALDAMRRFCRESTFWNNIKTGYLGAYFFDGFCSELLLRLAWELRERMPRVIGGLALQMMWGYKCDATLPGLGPHADAAAVNVNFWITQDEANLDPACGGLLVYERNAPRDWDFRRFNTESANVAQYLASVGSQPTRYPYKANRAVIFDSDLFHATDSPRFRQGYLDRRINITLLYGNRLAPGPRS